MSQVLLLNADAQPISFLPLSSITWQEAIGLLHLGKVEMLHAYEDWEVHSPSTTMQVPSVLMLHEQVTNVRHWIAREETAQKPYVFLRDMFVCQYCWVEFPRSRLTLDHVIPRKYGGSKRWENMTTACGTCNFSRGSDIRIQPKVKPYKPTYGQLLKNMKKFPIFIPQECWNYYLMWPDDKVIISKRRSQIRGGYQLDWSRI